MTDWAELSINFSPLLPESWLLALSVVGGVIFCLAFWRNRRAALWRGVTFSVFILALLNPSLLEEDRDFVPDVAAIILDESPSQKIGERAERSWKTLEYLKYELEKQDGLEVRTVVAASKATDIQQETKLFEAMEQALSDVPKDRRAGVFLITDGQIHDIPQSPDRFKNYGPVHTLLSGEKKERDRRLHITQAPAYGLVGKDITVQFRIEDDRARTGDSAAVRITEGNGNMENIQLPLNEDLSLDFTPSHAGQNVFEIQVDPVPGEITQANNQAAILVNGVRDRMKVLLVSGQPHAGGRMWRDLLTSDPGVDLVHFTILREPEKLDRTPQRELSLIAFPFRELFEVKLYDFDLIVFDRYRLNDVVPDRYFKNVAKFVKQGGALLAASGPDYASDRSLYMTSLAEILPALPTGKLFQKAFTPDLTDKGQRHPVTRGLTEKNANWGPWLRQAGITSRRGTDILMRGIKEEPLLLLNRVGEGRVAQFTSDHIWLWSRGYQGGGPSTELLRRVVHWLMKEPELDERALETEVKGKAITLRMLDYPGITPQITMTAPDGKTTEILLKKEEDGLLRKTIQAQDLGVYSFETMQGERKYALVGDLNPKELQGVKTTEELIRPISKESGGGIVWLSGQGQPTIRALDKKANNFAGRNWLALRKNKEYTVTGVRSEPLLPPWAALIILAGITSVMWWREGRF